MRKKFCRVKVCPICGKGFISRHWLRKYCSAECVRLAKNKNAGKYYREKTYAKILNELGRHV